MSLEAYELKLAAKLLQLAANEFSNHSCTDYDLMQEGGLSPEEALAINHGCAEQEGSLDDFSDADLSSTYAAFGSDGVMQYLASRFEEEAKQL